MDASLNGKITGSNSIVLPIEPLSEPAHNMKSSYCNFPATKLCAQHLISHNSRLHRLQFTKRKVFFPFLVQGQGKWLYCAAHKIHELPDFPREGSLAPCSEMGIAK